MNVRALVIGLFVGFAVAIAPSCGTAGTPKKDGGTDGGGTGGSTGNGGATGTGGQTGTGGGNNGCSGCLAGTQCISSNISATSNQNCGINGVQCVACQNGQGCNNGVCSVAGSMGALGDPCNSDNDCTNLNISQTDSSNGITPFCKKVTRPGNDAYPQGYCTHRCLSSASCGANGVCDFVDGPYGEQDNICLKSCSDQAPCRAGYGCYQYSQTASGCFPLLADGGDIGVVDAGPNFANGVIGQACADNTQCPPADRGLCFTATLPDGGLTGYTGGQCSGACNERPFSATFCGQNTACLPIVPIADTHGPVVLWLCNQACPLDGGASGCRAEYSCQDTGFGVGACAPRCNNPGAGCAMGQTCNTTTGECQ